MTGSNTTDATHVRQRLDQCASLLNADRDLHRRRVELGTATGDWHFDGDRLRSALEACGIRPELEEADMGRPPTDERAR